MKKQVPQMEDSTTGLTGDYINEFFGLELFVKKGGAAALARKLKARPVRTYLERYPPGEYDPVITSDNAAKIEELDGLVERINAYQNPECFDEAEFHSTYERIHELVYGMSKEQRQDRARRLNERVASR